MLTYQVWLYCLKQLRKPMNYNSKWNHIVSISLFNHMLSKLAKINGKSHGVTGDTGKGELL